MARNKYPEETERRILEVAAQLFGQKGYGKTTIQAIVDGLGMSKGAVYHHFKSKEEIVDRLYSTWRVDGDAGRLLQDPNLSGLEKLRQLLLQDYTDPGKLKVDALIQAQKGKDPYLLGYEMENITGIAPLIQQLLEEGNRDGSCSVSAPEAAAEILLLLLNFGMFPRGDDTMEETVFMDRLNLIQGLTEFMGMPLFDDKLTEGVIAYYRGFYEPKEQT